MSVFNKDIYDNYLKILSSELIPAMGCTEPIAIAYAAAKLKEVLGMMPEFMTVSCSGNIIKNVKGVVVPNSGGLRGVEAAAILGAFAGNAELELEVISQVSEQERLEAKKLYEKGICKILRKLYRRKRKLNCQQRNQPRIPVRTQIWVIYGSKQPQQSLKPA